MTAEDSLPQSSTKENPGVPVLVAIAAWMVPGLGHLLMRRWARALGFFVAVAGLAVAGFALRGEVFSSHSKDPFGMLGFIADIGSGIFYFIARFVETTGADISRASGDYGTRFIAASGIVNLLAVIDACGISRGRRV